MNCQLANKCEMNCQLVNKCAMNCQLANKHARNCQLVIRQVERHSPKKCEGENSGINVLTLG